MAEKHFTPAELKRAADRLAELHDELSRIGGEAVELIRRYGTLDESEEKNLLGLDSEDGALAIDSAACNLRRFAADAEGRARAKVITGQDDAEPENMPQADSADELAGTAVE